jgi:hypothetical protein
MSPRPQQVPEGCRIERAHVPQGATREHEVKLLVDWTSRVLAVIEDPRTEEAIVVVSPAPRR